MRIIAALLSLTLASPTGAGTGAPPPAEDSSAETPAQPSPPTGAVSPEAVGPVAVKPVDDGPPTDGPTALEAILPCGLRVVVAKDATLPVAATVLSVEVGTEQDPPELPGLVHALAYHLTQGNRELSPGGAHELVTNVGGWGGLAIGTRQVRYETVVPASALDDSLWIEAQRLRAPTVSGGLWRRTLRSARRDRREPLPLPWPAVAAVHGDIETLGRNGTRVTDELEKLEVDAIGKHLAERFRYELATLVVVAPEEPATIIARVARLMADLPRAQHRAVAPVLPPAGTQQPRAVNTPKARGNVVAFPIASDPTSAVQASWLCSVLNRQRRAVGESRRARVRCRHYPDPRRGFIVLTTSGTDDPVALVRSRFERIAGDRDQRLAQQQQAIARRTLVLELRTPLGLARRLAASWPDTREVGDPRPRAMSSLTGADALAEGAVLPPASIPDLGRGIVLAPASTKTPADDPPEAGT